jgi:predicted Zn-dependent protease
MKSNSLWAIIILGGFIGLFFWLRTIDWVGMFDIEKHTRDTEEKLGDLFWEHLGDEGDQITDTLTIAAMDTMVSRICSANAIPREHIKVHVFRADVVNAFAMPGGHLVVNSALIEDCKNPEQLCGVLAHEIAHIELRHVMKKLVREVGMSVLVNMTTGGGDGGQVGEVVGALSSKAFDRDMEREADMKGLDYLVNAHIDPHPFADFLYLTGDGESEEAFEWLSTHPSSKERKEYVLEEIGKHTLSNESVMHPTTWERLKESVATKDTTSVHEI